VVVVGGGIAGLVSAYELEKRGIPVTLLEASDGWGGRVATAYYGDGNFAEYGMQEMWASNPLLKIAKELKVPLDEPEGGKTAEPYSSLVLDGKFFPYVQPTSDAYFASFLKPAEHKALKAWMVKAKALRDRLEERGLADSEVDKLQSVSFANWVQSFGMSKRVNDWIRITLECELATDWESFSGVIGLAEFGFFLGDGEPNYHVKGGNSELIKALVGAIKGEKRLASMVTGIEHKTRPDGSVRVKVSYMRDQHLNVIEAERAVLAVPFVRVHQIEIDPPLSDDKWQGIMTLNRGQYTVVHLLMNKRARQKWLLKGESPFPVLTDGVLGVVYGVMREGPDSAKTDIFSLLIHGAAAGAFHMVPRETKVKQILAALDKLWPGLSGDVVGSEVFTYHPAAIPVWPPGRSPIDARGKALREPELGLYLVGDYTVSGHSNGAAQSAILAAERLAAELGPSVAHGTP
jgi:monoamine oxidase